MNATIHFFYLEIVSYIFFVSQLLQSVRKLGQYYSKITFCDIRATVFLQSYVIICRVVAYPKQKTKEYIKFLAQKVVAVALEIYVVVAYERVFETIFDWEIKRLFVK